MLSRKLLAAVGGQGVAPSFLFRDTLTDTDGVLLTNHTPEVGGSWENFKGSFDIKSNGARPKTTTSNETQAVASASASDGLITSSAEFKSNVGYIVRATDADNFFLIIYTASITTFQLFERLGGNFFFRATSNIVPFNFINGVFYPWEITLLGQSIVAEVTGENGVNTINFNSSNNQTSKKIGLRTFSLLPATPVFTELVMV